jgi:hypothetical protein
MKYRFYVVTDQGLRRLPLKALDGQLAAPQLASTRQKLIQVVYEWRGTRLFLNANGLHLSFDDGGVAHPSVEEVRSVVEVASVADQIMHERLKTPKVASIRLRQEERELMRGLAWAVSPAEVELISYDLREGPRPAGTSAIPFLKTTKIQ